MATRTSLVLLRLCLSATLLIGCSKKDDPDNAPGEVETTIDGERYSATIGPDGGTLELLDGVRLVFPSGALSESTEIVGIVPEEALRTADVHKFLFLPDGLIFEKPVKLHVPLSGADEALPLVGWQWSDLNPTQGEGRSELTNMAPVRHAEESSTDEAVLELDHFTFVFLYVNVSKWAYLTVDIPPQFLLPGDLLFTLTTDDDSNLGWNPGHVGMFAGGPHDCNVIPADEIIEATPPAVRVWHLGEEDGFRKGSEHRYLGPRRNKLEPLTPSEQTEVVEFARARVGSPYNVLLSRSGFLDTLTLSHPVLGLLRDDALPEIYNCVGLVEEALDSVDKGALPGLVEMTGSTPLEMYKVTGPVTEITVYAGENIEVPVYGTVVDPRSPNFLTTKHGWYCNSPSCLDGQAANRLRVTAENVPSGATWDDENWQRPVFRWQTSAEDAGRSAFVTFRMKSEGNLTVRGTFGGRADLGPIDEVQPLSITILPCPEDGSVCGDDESTGTEACDGDDLNEQSCDSLGLGSGEVSCTDECELDTTDCTEGATCGNGVAEPVSGEECDGSDLPETDCAAVGAGTGSLGCTEQCTYDTSSCTQPSPCGDGNVDAGEQCDGANLNGATCESVLGADYSGSLACDTSCEFDTSSCVMSSSCGNAVVEGTEACDGNDLAGETCLTQGFAGGALACDSTCALDTTGCLDEVCGDGALTGIEVCDGALLGGADCVGLGMGFDGGTLACNGTCDAYDTTACTTPSLGCMYDLGFTVYETTCAASGIVGGNFFCSFTNNSFQHELLTIDQACNGSRVIVNNLSDRCGLAADGAGIGLLERGSSSMANFRSVDMAGTLGPQVGLGVGSGAFLDLAQIPPPASGFAAFTAQIDANALSISRLGPNGAYIDTFPGPSMGGALVSESFTHSTATEIHAAVAVNATYAAPYIAAIHGVVIDRAGSTSVPYSYEIAQWADNSMPTLWDTLQHDDGDMQVWSKPHGSSVITVVDVGSGTLAPTSVGTVTTMNGTLGGFRLVRVPGNSSWLIGQVDDGVSATMRVIPIQDPPAATLDLTGGMELAPAGTVRVAAAGLDGFVVLLSNGEVYFVPVP